MVDFGLGAGRGASALPRRAKGFGLRRLRIGAGLGVARGAGLAGLTRFFAAFAVIFRVVFFAFARLAGLRRDAAVRFPPLRDAMCRMPEISAGAEAREMVNAHQGFNNRRRHIMLLGQPPEARRYQ